MESIWSQTCQIENREPLCGDVKTEIAVIGAGIAGVLIAHALQEAGCHVVVLEANRIASGQTQHTTAKITSQHGMIYQKLIQTVGKTKAQQYAMANETAVKAYRQLILSQNINCVFEERDAFIYGNDVSQLRAEADAAALLGLPASFQKNVDLPVSAAGAVRFTGQAQFHPLKFLRHMALPLRIYENTRVIHVEDTLLRTTNGCVRAEKIVFACHYPFINFPGMYFARMHQARSYVLALENIKRINGMWIGAGKEACSFRHYKDLLLLGGGGHRCGENRTGGKYDLLRQRAKEWFPQSREVACWSAQDCMTADGIPYIGRYAASHPNWYVATGFQKWGMTTAMVAAMLIRDAICKAENPYASVFDPARLHIAAVSGIVRESGHAVKGLTKRFLQLPSEKTAHLPNGHGGIVWQGGEKVGVFKDAYGNIHAVDIRCPHMGCQLEWNPDECSWDCPCHGSRFDGFGALLSDPAQEKLTQK